MPNGERYEIIMKNWGLSVLSGLLVAFSFPTLLFGVRFPDLGILAWVGLVPLLIVVYSSTPKRSFLCAWLTITLYHLISSYWIFTALHVYGGIPTTGSVFVLLLYALGMGIYPAVGLYLANWFRKKCGGQLLIWVPVFWTLAEYARHYTPFGGGPWSHIAMSQGGNLPFIQIADIAGVYGVIFLLIWANAFITETFLFLKRKEGIFFKQKGIVTLLMFGLTFGYGFYKLSLEKKDNASAPKIRVGLIQPNIPQKEKWRPGYLNKHKAIFNRLVAGLEKSVDLIIWPETAWTIAPTLQQTEFPPQDIGITAPQGKHPYTLLGLTFYKSPQETDVYYNSAALFTAQGKMIAKYHKTHLVPFGEYIPYRNILTFLKPVAAIGDFEAGLEVAPLDMEGIMLAPLICSEDLFPAIAREQVQKNANLLVNLTNDAWYGFSSQPDQHLALARFRAVETRRTLLSATNTGTTAVIDPTGETVIKSPLWEESVLIYNAPLRTETTLYVRLGNWFIAACILFILWRIIRLAWKKPG